MTAEDNNEPSAPSVEPSTEHHEEHSSVHHEEHSSVHHDEHSSVHHEDHSSEPPTALLAEKAHEEKKKTPSEKSASEVGDAPIVPSGPGDYLKMDPKKPLKYPKSVFFIVTNEFCERFCFYGMRTILSLYLVQYLMYSEDSATVVYHLFVSFCYLTPLLGGIIADSWLGRFKTILFLSIVYAIGSVSISTAAIPNFLPAEAFTYVGLVLIGLGTGGIKPCVSAFGGDQFVIPEQERQLQQFFSIFYFAVNGGSLLSTFITPILREDVKCFDYDSCYSLAFGVPAILMVVSIFVFVAGKPLYKSKKPEGNVMMEVCKCIGHGIKMRFKNKKDKKEHWLDHAEDKFSSKLINDTKLALNILVMFIPLLLFWALFDQQGSRWTFQATRMDGDLGGWNIKPDQMQVVNPLLIIILIPVFESTLYPLFKKLNIFQKPLNKMILGGSLAAVAFVLSALVELAIKPTSAVLPVAGEAQIRLLNTFDCPMQVNFNNGGPFVVEPLKAFENLHVAAQGNQLFQVNIAPGDGCPAGLSIIDRQIQLTENTAQSFIIHNGNSVTAQLLLSERFEDFPEKSRNGNGFVRVVLNAKDNARKVIELKGEKGSYTFKEGSGAAFATEITELDVGIYSVFVATAKVGEVEFRAGGVYSVLVNEDLTGENKLSSYLVTPESSVNMLWLIPQYFVITAGEVMFSITGLEFAFTQAPLSMKSVIVAGWYLSVAFGNIFVIIIAEVKFFKDQMWEFVLFAGLMAVSMVIFWLMSLRYKYVTNATEDSDAAVLDKKRDSDASDNHKD